MLKSAVALVTGGASGLGKATVEKFARIGSKVVLCDLPTSAGNTVAKDLGDDVIFVPVDIRSEQDVNTALEATKSKFGRLDVLVNCAGSACAYQTYNFNKDRPHILETFTEQIMVNTVGTFNVIRLSAGLFAQNEPNKDGQRGVIVNTSSYAAYDGQRGQAAWAASNAAIIGMTLPIAREFSSHGIRVVTIVPGLFDTPMCLGETPDDIREFLCETVLFPQRLGEPKEFVRLVQSIIDNPMLNGVSIRLDGGFRSFLYD